MNNESMDRPNPLDDRQLPIPCAIISLLRDETGTAVDARFDEINAAFAAFEQRTIGQMIGHTYREVFAPASMEFLTPFDKEARPGQPAHDLVFTEETGRYVGAWCYYLDPNRRLCTLCDETEQYRAAKEQNRRLQEALDEANKASKAKTDFFNSMSHDIRTPMNAIMNLARLVRDDLAKVGGGNVFEDLDKLDTACRALKDLINDVLDMSQIESGNITLHREVYDFSEYMQFIDAVFLPLAESKGITLRCIPFNFKEPLIQDKKRYNQILTNLLSNAVKYTPPGGTVTLRMIVEKVENGSFSGCLEVSDTGCGMSEEFQKRMFVPFERENRAGVWQEGTGLGLALVKRIVDQMDGTIEVKSKEDVGTTIRVRMTVPVATAEQIEESHRQQEKTQADCRITGLHILIAEDNPMNVFVLKRLLKKTGAVIDAAQNGKEAVERFAASEPGQYDAILMDIRMPVMNGIEATRQIRTLDREDAKAVPIIALTADVFLAEDGKAGWEAGMTTYLFKPVEPDKMFAALNQYVEHYRQQLPAKLTVAKPDKAENLSDLSDKEVRLMTLLRTFGCENLPETLARFTDDVSFYTEMLQEVLSDAGFARLGEELRAGDGKAAFETAHMLKGIIGNAGLTPLYACIVRLVEPLRAGNTEDWQPAYTRLMERRDALQGQVDAWQAS